MIQIKHFLKQSLLKHQLRTYFRGSLENVKQDINHIAKGCVHINSLAIEIFFYDILVFDESQNIVVMAGAGLSTASGIPDFR